MKREASARRSLNAIAGEFFMLAGEYRQVSARIASVEKKCEKTGTQRDQVLDITFTQVVSCIDQAATQMGQVAARLASCAEGEALETLESEAGRGSAEKSDIPAESLKCASAELRASACALARAMNRALDLVDEMGDTELVGNSHPFGHVIQGICIPYILLAAETLETKAV